MSTTSYADVSSNNGTIDVAAYKASGHTSLMVKATEGVGYTWYGGQSTAEWVHKLGLTVGWYGWIRPDFDPAAQADYFTHAVRPLLKPGDVLMGDFEATANVSDPPDQVRAQQLRTWATRVGNTLPDHELLVYTGNWYLDGKPAMQAECRRWPIVMSDYSGVSVLPNEYRLTYVAWQWTDTATVPGVPGQCDYNRLLNTHATDSITRHLLTNGAHTMYSLYRDAKTGHWYVGAVGYWQACRTRRDVQVASVDPLCANGHDVRAVLGRGRKARAALARASFATSTLADIKTQLLTIGGTK